jgi:8-amino-7-oxononanoate synthase
VARSPVDSRSPRTTHVPAAAARSLVDLLRHRAEAQPDRTVYTYLVDGEEQAAAIDHATLDRRARALAAVLQARTRPGDRVVLATPPGIQFIETLYACCLAGAVAVPAAPPVPRTRDRAARFARVVADSGSRIVLSTREIVKRIEDRSEGPETAEYLAVDELPADGAERWRPWSPGPDDLAILQYTSGSTADAKGVMVSHANLLANLACLHDRLKLDEDSTAVLWLPPYHDMGLIGGILLALYSCSHVTLMTPWHFLQRPGRWLRAVSRTRATHMAAPNFALDLCVEHTTEEQRAALDLSAVRMFLLGGETVRADSLDRFSGAFAVARFDPRAFSPAYGLAEATLMVTIGEHGVRPAVTGVAPDALREGRVLTQPAGGPGRHRLVGCGRPAPGHEVRIVDPATLRPADPGRVGEIWVRGASVAGGYWNRPDLSATCFRATLAGAEPGAHLRTGDLGFVDGGELYVVGRLKDLIIVRGLNYHPEDIELTVERADPALVPAGGVAFSSEVGQQERLVIVHEVRARGAGDEAILSRAQAAVSMEHGIALHRLVLVPRKSIPRTTSGKVQRGLCRQMLERGELTILRDWSSTDSGPAQPDGRAADDVIAWIQAEVARLGGLRSPAPLDVTLAGAGLDSVRLAELVQGIEARFRVSLVLADVPRDISIAGLATCVVSGEGPAPAAARAAPTGAVRDEGAGPFVAWEEVNETRNQLAALESLGANPFFRVHQGIASSTTLIDGEALINFSSYNYLGLCGDPDVSGAAKDAIDRFGTSVSASRLVSGERGLHHDLEAEIARFVGVEDAIVLVSGNLANVTTLGHLARPADLIVHDALAHDSIVRGAILSGAARRAFPHNDWAALDRLLDAVRGSYDRTIVALEGVYSMDGDIPDLPRFIEVKERHGCVLMVDEAHSMGVLGATGRGVSEHFGVDPRQVDIWMGTLSKSLASCGGYIAGQSHLVTHLRYSAPGFVFSVGIPPPNAAAALAALRKLQAEPERVERLRERARLFLQLSHLGGLDTGLSGGSPVIPVILGSSVTAVMASHLLAQRGVNVQPIVHPAVQEGGARLRFFVCADHTEPQIRHAVAAAVGVARELGVTGSGSP